MKSKSNGNLKIRYSKGDSEENVLIQGHYAENHHWTIVLDDRAALERLADVIIDVLSDVQDVSFSEDDSFQLHSGD